MLPNSRTQAPFRVVTIEEVSWHELSDAPTLRIAADEVLLHTSTLSLRLTYQAYGNLISHLPEGKWTGLRQSLEVVGSHKDAGPGLIRYGFPDAPLHVALHQIVQIRDLTDSYCSIHAHADAAELNAIIPGPGGLVYDVYLDDWFQVSAPQLLWFTADVPHCATAARGVGFFFVVRVPVSVT